MKTLIAIPTSGQPEANFVKCLLDLKRVGTTSVALNESSLIFGSRDKLAKHAIDEKTDFVLWLDDDMVFHPDTLEALIKDLEREKADAVCGLFFRRRPPYNPALWRKVRLGIAGEGIAEQFDDYPKDRCFDIDACGMAATLVRTECLAEVMKECKTCFVPIPGYGEDISFCIRAKKLGYRLICDPTVKVGHIGQMVITEKTFEEYKRVNESLPLVDVLGGVK